MIVSNIGMTPDLSAIYTPNSGAAHGLRPGEPEQGAQGQHLHLHGPGAAEAGFRSARTLHLLPNRRPGGFGGQHGHARAHRHPGKRQQPARGVCRRQRDGGEGAPAAGRERRAHPAGPGLSRHRAQCAPGDGGAAGAHRHRCGQQRGHGADLERHDRSQLLGRSAQREQLLPHRAVHQPSARLHEHGGLQADSAARQGQQQHHHAGERGRHQDDQHANGSRPLPALPQDRRLRLAQGRGPGRRSPNRCRRSSTTPSCRRTYAWRCAAR